MPQHRTLLSRLLPGALLLTAIATATPQARALCLGEGGTWVHEVDVISCTAPLEQLKEALEADKGRRPTFDPVFELGQTDEERKAAAAKAEKLRQAWERDFEARGNRLRATKAVILEVTLIRQKHYYKNPRLDSSAKAEWEGGANVAPVQVLLRTDGSTQCDDLLKSRIVLLDTSPCCDVLPYQELACVLHIRQAELAPDLVGD